MLKNVFRTNPISLIMWSLDKAVWQSTRIVLFGQQPLEIQKDLNKALSQHTHGKKIEESALLRKYFGVDWKSHMGLGKDKVGGDPLDGLDYGNNPPEVASAYDMIPKEPVVEIEEEDKEQDIPADFTNEVETLEIMDTEQAVTNEGSITEITLQDLAINLEDLVAKPTVSNVKSGTLQFVYDVDIYPEDKVSEFKLKICQAFQIPIFRQHVWYRTSGQSFPLSYNFLQGGSTQTVNMNQVIESDLSESICGIPVNMFLYRNKDTIKIEAYDNFTLLGNIYKRNGITEYNIVDLETFIAPRRQELTEISKNDKYQLQMLFYGFVTKFYPMLNLAAFVEYLDERSISQSYPQLEPIKDDLAYLAKQQVLMRELYTLYEGDESRVNRIDETLHKSLTETTMKVVSSARGKLINLRILFDLYPLNDKVDALRLYDQVDGKPIMLDKYREGGKASQEKLIPGVIYFRVIVSEQPKQHLNLFIYPNGAYAIKSVWGEDQNYEFSDVNLIVDKHINPIIAQINSMSNVMYNSSNTLPKIEKSNVKFIDISISMFWKKILTTGEFRQLKGVLDQFASARIIQEKQVDKNTIVYFFKRGMYEFDPRRIEKTALVDNYYAYLFNSDVRQKWFMLFENIRVMTVTHRFSDVKIEISGIKEDEYYIFIRYLVLLMSQFMRERGTNAPKEEERKITKPLSNLKEQDPHLYNFKKLYNSELVYSKLCQKPYQPNLLTQGQYDNLDKKGKDTTTKYWNFTTSTDAYYQCPNPKFPHVRFITGKHPMGYCIPCCKITAPPANPKDKQRMIYDQCIREHTFEKREVERSTSRYIMSYGKPIDIGRLSHLPETSLEPLFYETKPEDQGHTATEEDDDIIGSKYYLYGVPQNHPNAKHCGLLYCFSHSMGMNIESLVTLISSKLEKYSKNFQLLLNGTIVKWFSQPSDLVSEMRNVFLTDKKIPTGSSFTQWNELFQDIALQFLEICTIAFEDRDTVIQLRLPDYLDNIDDIKYPKHMHMIVLHNLTTDYWNPVYILHKDLYFRAGIIDRKLFAFQSDIVQLIMEMIRTKRSDEVHHRLTYDVLRQFVEQSSRYTITQLLVTRDNLCYGVNVEPVGYVPVHLSHFKFQEELNISFLSSDIVPANSIKLNEFCTRYNNWVAKQSEAGGFIRVDVQVTRPLLERIEPIYPILIAERWLVLGTKVIAWKSYNLNFYIEPITQAQAIKLEQAPFQEISYNPISVNGILEREEVPKPDKRTELVDYALYRNYLYQLLILEFIQLFNRQRNVKVREQLNRLFMRTDFKQPTNNLVLDIQTAILQGFEKNAVLMADVEKIKSQVVEWLLSGGPKKMLMQSIGSEYYAFDLVVLERLKRLPRNQIHAQLTKLASQFVEIGDVNKKSFHFPNILTSCYDTKGKTKSPDYCNRGKLVISKKYLDKYLEILADQIKNPFVEKYLFSPLFQTSMIDYFSFKYVVGEIIEIEFL